MSPGVGMPPPAQHPQAAWQGTPTSTPTKAAMPAPEPTDVGEPSNLPEWSPNADDRIKLDKWFNELQDDIGFVGGAKAVAFLKSTNLNRDNLKLIWTFVDTAKAGKIDRTQFYKIMRLVSISCYPVYMGSQPSMDRYHKTAYEKSIPLPPALILAEEAKAKAEQDAVEQARKEAEAKVIYSCR